MRVFTEVAGQHLVDREVAAHVAQELDVVLVGEPVGVVQQDAAGFGRCGHHRAVRQVAEAGLAEVDEAGELGLDPGRGSRVGYLSKI